MWRCSRSVLWSYKPMVFNVDTDDGFLSSVLWFIVDTDFTEIFQMAEMRKLKAMLVLEFTCEF